MSLRAAAIALFVGTTHVVSPALGQDDGDPLGDATGRQLMEAVYDRHAQYPFVYEEQSMVLIDRADRKETRQLRRYSRVDATGETRILLHFRFPREVQGVALLATRSPNGAMARHVFLPALGPYLIANGESGMPGDQSRDDHFLGTDFSIENLTGEVLDDYRYHRRDDAMMEDADYYVVDVYPALEGDATQWPRRRHFIRKDALFITRTDHLDRSGDIKKRQTQHDLVPVAGDVWRANMILMENFAEHHRSIVKIDRRVFSPDYVPEDVFTSAWIFANAPPQEEPEDDEPATLPEIAAGGAVEEVRP